MNRCSDEELAVRIPVAGAEEVNCLWDELLARHELLIVIVARRMRMDPQDLQSALYVRLKGENRDWAPLRGYRACGAPFTYWLAVVAFRVATPRKQRSKPLQVCGDVQAPGTPETEAVRRLDVLSAITRLRHAECRVLIRRRYWNRETFEEMADVFGRTSGSLRQVHRRNLRELEGILKDEP